MRMRKMLFTFHSSSSLTTLLFLITIFSSYYFSVIQSEKLVTNSIRLPSDSMSGDIDDTNPCPASGNNKPASCPVTCFRTDPVCGVDGVTYWCGCSEAICAGTRVAKLGYCEVGSGGAAPLSGQALLLVHIVWLIVLGFSVLFGLF